MRLFLVIFSIVLIFSISIFAQESVTLSLDKATELAFVNNASIIQAQNDADAAGSGVLAAYGSYLPTISASGGWNRSQNDQAAGERAYQGLVQTFPAIFSVRNSFSTGINARYTIFDGLRRESNFARASASANSSDYGSIRMKQTIRFQIGAAYLNVLRLEQLVKVSEENLKRDNRQLERITESNRIGALSLADVYRQQSQVAADELSVINAQNNYDKAKADLVALIGLDMTKKYEFIDPGISTNVDQSELNDVQNKISSIDEYTKRALSSRPDYLAVTENLNYSEAGVTSAWGGYLPSVTASASYDLGAVEFSKMKDNKTISWGIGLSWNIFDGFLTNQSIQTARANKKNVETKLRQAGRDIIVEIQKVLLDLEAAKKQVEVSHKGLQSATEDRKIAEERYNLGAGTLLDLLTANAGLINAEANNINASYFYNTTKRNLEYVLGERNN